MNYPKKILHFVNNQEIRGGNGYFEKVYPANGKVIAQVCRGSAKEVEAAVGACRSAYSPWSQTNIVKRSNILRETTILMRDKKKEIAEIVSIETGKSKKDAISETEAAIELGFFIAGEGRRFYGRTTTSAVENRFAYTVRQPAGVCALITAANTPIANVAWKAFPAILCGNASIMKPSEDTPYTAIYFAKILKESGLPSGVFNVIQGLGVETGSALVENPDIDLVSFTGSVEVGKYIQKTAGARLKKVCLELGGKNPLVVCDDCDLERAVGDAVLSAFSNAGQRCASASRIIVFEKVYEKFRKLFIDKTDRLKVGNTDADDIGPVINFKHLDTLISAIKQTVEIDNVKVLTGGKRLTSSKYKSGFYLEPTIIENVSMDAEISQQELFGPITCLYKVKDLREAIDLANSVSFGLTAAIHTKNIHWAEVFKNEVQAGVVSINGPTYGSEPHMPFGGVKNSGTGFREPGTEALDVYSELKTVYVKHENSQI